jgi:putative MATE family efflux protein
MDDRIRALLTAKPLPLLIRMGTPNTLAFFVQASVSMTEVWFIGQLGSVSLAAIALAFPLLMLIQTMSGGAMGGAVASAIARSMGAGDVERAERLIWHALALALAGAIVFLVTFLLFGERFLGFLGGSGRVLDASFSYCLVIFTGGIFLWLMGVLSAVYRGLGDMQFPAGLMVAGAFIQVPVSGCLVLGWLGAPQLGIVGAGFSAIFTGFIVSSVMFFRLITGNTAIKLRRRAMVFSRARFDDILSVFVPASLSPFLTVATILSLTAVVGSFGESALAGYGIGSRIEFLLIPLIFGLGAAMTSLVGMNIGAGNVDRAEQIGWIGGCASAVLAGSIGLLLAAFPDAWIPAFTSDPEIHQSARDYIRIVGPFFAFQGLGLSLYFASQGAGAMLWPVSATILRIVIAVGGALIFAVGADFGLRAVYFAAAFGMVIYGVMIAGSLKFGAWRS